MNLSLFPNYVEDSVQDSLEAARSFIGQCNALTAHLPSHRRLVEPVVTPRFVPTCTDELLSGLGKIAEETGVRIQSHLAEAQDQVDRVRETTGREDIDVFDGVSIGAPLTRPRLGFHRRSRIPQLTTLAPDAAWTSYLTYRSGALHLPHSRRAPPNGLARRRACPLPSVERIL